MSMSTPEPTKPAVVEEEDWDEPSGVAKTPVAEVEIPIFRPDSSLRSHSSMSAPEPREQRRDQSIGSAAGNGDEEDWDAEIPGEKKSGNGFAADIPTWRPSSSNGEPFGDSAVGQRYENSYHSNKYPPRGGGSDRFQSGGDRFGGGREPFNRHGRGNRLVVIMDFNLASLLACVFRGRFSSQTAYLIIQSLRIRGSGKL